MREKEKMNIDILTILLYNFYKISIILRIKGKNYEV